jgi:hypothetical protein
LPADELLDPVEIILHEAAGIRITCAQPDQTPVAAKVALVLLAAPAGGHIDVPKRVTVGLEGAEVTGLPAGVRLGATAFVNGAPAGIVEIEPLVADEMRDVHIETLALSAVALRMIDGRGAPVEGVFLARPIEGRELPGYPDAWPRGDRASSWKSRVECAADGTGVLHLPPGDFNIQARSPDYVLAGERVVPVPSFDEEVFVIGSQPGRVGRLTDGEGRPLANWGIQTRGERGRSQKGITGPEGDFAFAGPSGDRLRVSGIHPLGLRVELFDSRLGDWPADDTLTVELHSVRVSIVDLRTGSPVSYELSVRDRSVREPIDAAIGFPVLEGDTARTVTLQLPAGEWNFIPSDLRPGPAVESPGGKYEARMRHYTIDGDRDIVFVATHYTEPRFTGPLGASGEESVLQWVAAVEDRLVEGKIVHPPTPLFASSIPIGDVELEVIRGAGSWAGRKKFSVAPDGRIPD